MPQNKILDTSPFHFAWRFLFLNLLAGTSFRDEQADRFYICFVQLSNVDISSGLFGVSCSPPKRWGVKLLPILLCPTFGKSLKGNNGCQRQSFLLLQSSPSIWHLQVTFGKSGEGSDNQTERLQSPALWGAPDTLVVDRGGGLWNTEIASAASEEAHLSTGYWESDCDNEVIKRWQWGIPANSKQHPGASHLLGLLCVLTVELICEGSGQLGLMCPHVGGPTVISYWVHALHSCLAAVAEWRKSVLSEQGNKKFLDGYTTRDFFCHYSCHCL